VGREWGQTFNTMWWPQKRVRSGGGVGRSISMHTFPAVSLACFAWWLFPLKGIPTSFGGVREIMTACCQQQGRINDMPSKRKNERRRQARQRTEGEMRLLGRESVVGSTEAIGLVARRCFFCDNRCALPLPSCAPSSSMIRRFLLCPASPSSTSMVEGESCCGRELTPEAPEIDRQRAKKKESDGMALL
jgi:hypothetical protein